MDFIFSLSSSQTFSTPNHGRRFSAADRRSGVDLQHAPASTERFDFIRAKRREQLGLGGSPSTSRPRSPLLHHSLLSKGWSHGHLFNGDTREPDFFSKTGLVKGNPFKYAGSSWFGYVDEGTHGLGRRDILVSWRGTKAGTEWLNNANVYKTSASDIFSIAKALGAALHTGFRSLYTRKTSPSRNKTSARQQVLDAVRELVNRYKDEDISITVTGFSLGGALATLTAMDIVVNAMDITSPPPAIRTSRAWSLPSLTAARVSEMLS
ncbi:hypothetical protein GQ457_01G049040 [Hibiscus cannabinus]